MKHTEFRKIIKEEIVKVLKENQDLLNRIKQLQDYNETEDAVVYKNYIVQFYNDEGYNVFRNRGEYTGSDDSPILETPDPKKVVDFLMSK